MSSEAVTTARVPYEVELTAANLKEAICGIFQEAEGSFAEMSAVTV